MILSPARTRKRRAGAGPRPAGAAPRAVAPRDAPRPDLALAAGDDAERTQLLARGGIRVGRDPFGGGEALPRPRRRGARRPARGDPPIRTRPDALQQGEGEVSRGSARGSGGSTPRRRRGSFGRGPAFGRRPRRRERASRRERRRSPGALRPRRGRPSAAPSRLAGLHRGGARARRTRSAGRTNGGRRRRIPDGPRGRPRPFRGRALPLQSPLGRARPAGEGRVARAPRAGARPPARRAAPLPGCGAEVGRVGRRRARAREAGALPFAGGLGRAERDGRFRDRLRRASGGAGLRRFRRSPPLVRPSTRRRRGRTSWPRSSSGAATKPLSPRPSGSSPRPSRAIPASSLRWSSRRGSGEAGDPSGAEGSCAVRSARTRHGRRRTRRSQSSWRGSRGGRRTRSPRGGTPSRRARGKRSSPSDSMPHDRAGARRRSAVSGATSPSRQKALTRRRPPPGSRRSRAPRRGGRRRPCCSPSRPSPGRARGSSSAVGVSRSRSGWRASPRRCGRCGPPRGGCGTKPRSTAACCSRVRPRTSGLREGSGPKRRLGSRPGSSAETGRRASSPRDAGRSTRWRRSDDATASA